MKKARKITMDSPELLKLINERGELVTKGRTLSAKIEKDQKALNKTGLQAQKLTDKIKPILDKLVKPQLGDFEDVSNVAVEDGKVVVNIYDRVEDFKEQFLKAKKDSGKQ